MHHLYPEYIDMDTLPQDLEELLQAYRQSIIDCKSNVEFALVIHISNMLTYIKDSHPEVYDKYIDEYLTISELSNKNHDTL
jgi:hypothetical protein